MPVENNPPFKVLGISHIGLAPKQADQTKHFFELVGFKNLAEDLVKSQLTQTTMFQSKSHSENAELSQANRLEILQPFQDQGPIAKYLEKKGGGIHHIAFRVDDINAAIKYLTDNQIQLIGTEASLGAHGSKVIFIHPKSTGGLLFELVQEQ